VIFLILSLNLNNKSIITLQCTNSVRDKLKVYSPAWFKKRLHLSRSSPLLNPAIKSGLQWACLGNWTCEKASGELLGDRALRRE